MQITERVNKPVFNYSQLHRVECVSKELVDLILEGHVVVLVFSSVSKCSARSTPASSP